MEYTIDELARAAGTTVRSLRVYHERGVLPSPEVRGRTGYYGPEHLNRIQTISRLLDRGIKLNGIRELLEAWDRGDDLGDILGVIDPGATSGDVPLGASAPAVTIPATELAQRYGDLPHGLARVVALGLYEPVDAVTYRVADGQLAGVVDRLVGVGLPIAEVLGELEKLRVDAERIARRTVDLLQRTAWAAYQNSERTTADLGVLSEQLTTARTVMAQTSAELVDRFVRTYLDGDADLSEALAGA